MESDAGAGAAPANESCQKMRFLIRFRTHRLAARRMSKVRFNCGAWVAFLFHFVELTSNRPESAVAQLKQHFPISSKKSKWH